jgi:hypothetical protein
MTLGSAKGLHSTTTTLFSVINTSISTSKAYNRLSVHANQRELAALMTNRRAWVPCRSTNMVQRMRGIETELSSFDDARCDGRYDFQSHSCKRGTKTPRNSDCGSCSFEKHTPTSQTSTRIAYLNHFHLLTSLNYQDGQLRRKRIHASLSAHQGHAPRCLSGH